jgi:selenocysteine lyase/cysteine desulfurase
MAATTRWRRRGARCSSSSTPIPELYEVIFTLNASGALKLIAEAYPWEPGGRFLLTADNHNSSTGCASTPPRTAPRCATFRWVPSCAWTTWRRTWPARSRGAAPLRLPAQSNFSGVKHPLEWVETARAHGYHVLLDAARSSPPARSDLGEHGPDFVTLSFYKMFGYPTGVGALLARRNMLGELHRPWFSGGTVRFVSAQNGVHLSHVTGRAFEDGTLNYLGISAVSAGLDFLGEMGMGRINAHVMRLTGLLLHGSPRCGTRAARRWCACTGRRER